MSNILIVSSLTSLIVVLEWSCIVMFVAGIAYIHVKFCCRSMPST